ncbi:hypothetical protein MTP99_014197 [Tenebrio molitor]|jgi:hypothetical protein|nr:hypothetical protein MTP99_014197 [Tenebrio molitor]
MIIFGSALSLPCAKYRSVGTIRYGSGSNNSWMEINPRLMGNGGRHSHGSSNHCRSGSNHRFLNNRSGSVSGNNGFADNIGSVLVTDGGRHGNSWGSDHGWGGDGRVTQETTRFSCDDGNESGQHHQFEHFDCFRSVLTSLRLTDKSDTGWSI